LSRADGKHEWQRALDLPLDQNIAALSARLWQEGIPHRIFEWQGRQIVEVRDATHAAHVAALHAAWRAGALSLAAIESPRHILAGGSGWRHALMRYPVLVAVLAIAVIAYPATWPLDAGSAGMLLPWLTYVPIEVVHGRIVAGTLSDVFARGEYWRLLTPALLHFSFAHLAFNVAAMCLFGRAVERGVGHRGALALVVVTALASNAGQYAWGSGVLFGGLSGVAYGLFGFVVVRARQAPTVVLWRLPPAFVVVMFASLLLFSSGVTESFGLSVANAAHWCGLATGALCALIVRPGRMAFDV
jgi:GlpG protein